MKTIRFLFQTAIVVLALLGTPALAVSPAEVIAKAQTMTNEELYRKAIEESNGKVLYGIGNSSRGRIAGESFLRKLKSIDPSYTGTLEWANPKNNSIFAALNADIKGGGHIYSMALIQDGNQLQSKMIDTGNLLNFIPKEWAEGEGTAVEGNDNPLVLLTVNKAFLFNNVGSASYQNCWDFVSEGEAPLFMGIHSELVGKNFLYMLTKDVYADVLKEAFDALSEEKKAYFAPVIEKMAPEAEELGLEAENAKYALAWIKLWVEQYSEQTDDGPICNTLVMKSAAGQPGLLVYSKLNAIQETEESSVGNITVAAYQDGYTGIGGYTYPNYLQIPRTSPLPWTACAFIAYMTTTQEGFDAWGKSMGSYSPNPACNQNHSSDGYVDGVNLFPAKNDRGYEWWTSVDGGCLVAEDPAYCAEVAFELGDWIDMIEGTRR